MASKRSTLNRLPPRVPLLGDRVPVLSGDSWRAGKQGANARLYTYRWQKASKAFLREHPLCQCQECDEGRLRVRPSTVVDHRVPHRGDEALFWDPANWQAMAKGCHDRKTASEGSAAGPGAR